MSEEDYQALASIFHRADIDGVIIGMGHYIAELSEAGLAKDNFALPRLRVRDQLFDPGFAAIIGPFGVYPLRTREDHFRLREVRELNFTYAVVSLSLQYALSTIQSFIGYGEQGDASERLATRHGLTVCWPRADDEITIEDD